MRAKLVSSKREEVYHSKRQSMIKISVNDFNKDDDKRRSNYIKSKQPNQKKKY